MRSMRYLTLTLLLVFAAGCTGQGDGGHEPLRVGTSLPLTGERAQLGLATRSGYEVWQDMVNMGGGLLAGGSTWTSGTTAAAQTWSPPTTST
jgi:ABC-type branched-subunit amino acid transport system substrate-binding protein